MAHKNDSYSQHEQRLCVCFGVILSFVAHLSTFQSSVHIRTMRSDIKQLQSIFQEHPYARSNKIYGEMQCTGDVRMTKLLEKLKGVNSTNYTHKTYFSRTPGQCQIDVNRTKGPINGIQFNEMLQSSKKCHVSIESAVLLQPPRIKYLVLACANYQKLSKKNKQQINKARSKIVECLRWNRRRHKKAGYGVRVFSLCAEWCFCSGMFRNLSISFGTLLPLVDCCTRKPSQFILLY